MVLLIKEGTYTVKLKTNQKNQFVLFPDVYVQDHVEFEGRFLKFKYRQSVIFVPVNEIQEFREDNPYSVSNF